MAVVHMLHLDLLATSMLSLMLVHTKCTCTVRYTHVHVHVHVYMESMGNGASWTSCKLKDKLVYIVHQLLKNTCIYMYMHPSTAGDMHMYMYTVHVYIPMS